MVECSHSGLRMEVRFLPLPITYYNYMTIRLTDFIKKSFKALRARPSKLIRDKDGIQVHKFSTGKFLICGIGRLEDAESDNQAIITLTIPIEE